MNIRAFLVICLLLVWLPSSCGLAVWLIGRAKRRLLAEHPEFSKYPNLGFLFFNQSNMPFMPWYGLKEPDIATFRSHYYRLRLKVALATVGLAAVFIFAFLIFMALTPA